MSDAPILLGVVGRPHGVRGQLHVHSYTVPPEQLAHYGTLTDPAGRRFSLRWTGAGVAALAEITPDGPRPVTTREAAERLTNTRLHVDRAALPPADEDEFYLADLIGLPATTEEGAPLGQVTAVHDYGAGASLEIGAMLLPFTRACVPVIDLPARRLVVCPPHELLVEGAAP